MNEQRGLHGEGSIFPLIDRGKQLGYQASLGEKGNYHTCKFHANTYYGMDKAHRAAEKWLAELKRKQRRLYGLPLRPYVEDAVYPKHHLPYGVGYTFQYLRRSGTFYFLFYANYVTEPNGINRKFVLNVGNVETVTEDQLLFAQDHVIDIRRQFSAAYHAGEAFDVTPWQQGRWRHFSPISHYRYSIDYKSLGLRYQREYKKKPT